MNTLTTKPASARTAFAVIAISATLLGGCATNRNPDDPLEGYNRAMFSFNEQVDKAVVKPVAQAYQFVLPDFLRTGVGNFIGNLEDPWTGLNNLLQGKAADGMSDLMRFFMNSTFGLLGVLDVATDMGLPKHDEDFGQTLGRWGVGEGAYIVLPFFGPRTVRDTAALPADWAGQHPLDTDHVPTLNTFTAVRAVHARSTFLGTERTLDEATTDKYAYTRDFYLEQRRYKVLDGKVMREYEDFDAQRAPLPGERIDRTAEAAVESLELSGLGANSLVMAITQKEKVK